MFQRLHACGYWRNFKLFNTNADAMLRSKEQWEKIYQEARTPRDFQQPEPYLVKLVEDKTIKPGMALDLGCGPGNEVIYLAQNGFTVTGVDISEIAIHIAEQRASAANIACEFIVSNVLTVPLKNQYDFVLDRACFHFLDPQERSAYIRNLHGILRPAGLFLLIVSSDQESAKGTYQFSIREIEDLFSKDFEILSLELVELETHAEKPMPYVVL